VGSCFPNDHTIDTTSAVWEPRWIQDIIDCAMYTRCTQNNLTWSLLESRNGPLFSSSTRASTPTLWEGNLRENWTVKSIHMLSVSLIQTMWVVYTKRMARNSLFRLVVDTTPVYHTVFLQNRVICCRQGLALPPWPKQGYSTTYVCHFWEVSSNHTLLIVAKAARWHVLTR
jgi:hypothetical protein